jgi:enoyl-CoA hydratase/carnithine racemase
VATLDTVEDIRIILVNRYDLEEATVASEEVLYEVDSGVATITLNRPDKLNSITPAMRQRLFEVFDETDRDDCVRAVVLTGAGRAFCAGIDLSAGPSAFSPDGKSGGDHEGDSLGPLTLRIYDSLKPSIAAINGVAVGLGATTTLAMDIRLAADTARMGFVFARRGVIPDSCSSWFLPRVVGIGTALEWTVTGRMIDATEACDAGLVRSVHPVEELLAVAHRIGDEIARFTAPVSVALTRQLMWRMLGASHPSEAARAEALALYSRSRSGDAQEGVTSLMEKRDPMFPDRVSDGLPDLFS